MNTHPTLVWRKSSYSGNDPSACVEVARSSEAVAARDSKHPERDALSFAPSVWAALLDGIKRG